MKKIGFLSISLIILLSLGACKKEKNVDSNESHSVSVVKDEKVSNEVIQSQTTSDQTDYSVSVSDTGYHDLTPKDDLVEARDELYEAGINSASISDEDLRVYLNDAKLKNIDLATFISNNVLK
ncbi:hypothetical protein OZX60_05740 [Streptococcaceae bacterium ESL0687]|nr:hypothetical protein OZX60_05740 [Streptococcaceae bacterium ESL0687]